MMLFDFGQNGDCRCYRRNSFYDFFTRIGIINNDKLNEYIRLNKGIFLTIQLQNYCFVSRNPIYVKRDDKQRMHCTT